MIKHGPLDVIVLAFGEPRFDGSILAELERQAAERTIPGVARVHPASYCS